MMTGKRALMFCQSDLKKNLAIIKLKGIDTIEQAEEIKGKILYCNRDDATIDEEVNYIADLIGCCVVDIDSGKEYGKVVDVLNYGSCDIYDTVSSGKHILIPATPDIVKEINTQYQIIKIKAMKGLLMRIDIMTLFPDMCNAVLSESIIGRARQAGKVEINCVDIRNYTLDKHRRVDDKPYGGGMGMIMAPQPIYDCYKAICEDMGAKPHLIYLTPQGKTLTQQRVKELSKLDNLVLLCGHYEGIDERVIEELDPEEISVGDYVLTGGELPALILADSVSRMLPGVLSDDECFEEESHFNSLLEYPQYTHPSSWNGRDVPEILLSGHHAKVDEWRRQKSLERTYRRRPDMLERAKLDKKRRSVFVET